MNKHRGDDGRSPLLDIGLSNCTSGVQLESRGSILSLMHKIYTLIKTYFT